jgi:cytochrome c553
MSRRTLVAALALLLPAPAWPAADASAEFAQAIRPVLVQNCAACHNPGNPNNPANFLKAQTVQEMEADRGLWRNVAAQLRNRTMPPVESKLTEADRLRISQWVDGQLRATACNIGDYAGVGTVRRLNRREYHNTIRDLLGVDFDVSSVFPADGTGGAGFDTNGDTLYIQPMLMERYMQAAQQILDRVIITPRLTKTFPAAEIQSIASNGGAERAVSLSIYLDGDYTVRAAVDPSAKLELRVDGVPSGALAPQRRAGRGGRGGGGGLEAQVHLDRGTHNLSLVAPAEASVAIASLTVEQNAEEVSAEKRALHYRLLGTEPGDEPLQPRKAAQQVLTAFLPKAFRRPVQAGDVERFLALYDRAAERGDPYEERIKLALRTVLMWPDFLFRMEDRKVKPGIYPAGQYEMANRLSYFLWSTMPDEQLFRLAAEGRLQNPPVLAAEVERMLDDPRSRTFTSTFVGQWLNTQDIGGRFMPILQEIQSYYNADIAADLRTQPILLFDRIMGENRSLLELLDGDYTYLTKRLVTFYQMDAQFKDITDNHFHLVQLPDSRRAGVLGLAGVLGMTSHYEQTSPVLRGAWVLETLLGTPVPPPPPNVPPLEAGDKVTSNLTTRERVLQHRADPACSACHKLMDPIGFGLENFDWMGRWRDKEADGRPIDASGELPSGETFNGPMELRQVLLQQKDTFLRQLTSKVLGYALGRSLQDGDSCTVQRLVETVVHDNYRARTLIREVVLSVPFRNTQAGVANAVPIDAPSLNISKVTSQSQDAKVHDNGEALPVQKK